MADGHTQCPGQRLLKQPNHGGCGLRIQLPGGLVQKERLRPHQQHPRQTDALLLAARQHSPPVLHLVQAVLQAGQPHLGQCRLQPVVIPMPPLRIAEHGPQ